MYQTGIKSDLLSAVVSIFGFSGDLDVNHVCMCGSVMYGVFCVSEWVWVFGGFMNDSLTRATCYIHWIESESCAFWWVVLGSSVWHYWWGFFDRCPNSKGKYDDRTWKSHHSAVYSKESSPFSLDPTISLCLTLSHSTPCWCTVVLHEFQQRNTHCSCHCVMQDASNDHRWEIAVDTVGAW